MTGARAVTHAWFRHDPLLTSYRRLGEVEGDLAAAVDTAHTARTTHLLSHALSSVRELRGWLAPTIDETKDADPVERHGYVVALRFADPEPGVRYLPVVGFGRQALEEAIEPWTVHSERATAVAAASRAATTAAYGTLTSATVVSVEWRVAPDTWALASVEVEPPSAEPVLPTLVVRDGVLLRRVPGKAGWVEVEG